MNIKTLTALKENEFFDRLNEKQSQYDAKDSSVRNDQFTRSPMHAIQFLIVYAGLDDSQRNKVATKLDANLTKKQLDDLVNDIDWVAVLTIPKLSTLEFEFQIAIANKNFFLDAVKERCPQLFLALINSKQSSVKIIDRSDEIKFITSVTQTESWSRPFIREEGDNFWNVPQFRLSAELQTALDALDEGQVQTIGGFTIKKGTGPLAKKTELHIAAPAGRNKYLIESSLETNPGIYDAFIGLNNFYGLSHVDSLSVEMINHGQFSDKGACASQTQINTAVAEGFCFSTSTPTIVEVEQLNVFFEAAGIVANFTDGTKKTNSFDPQMYVELPTKSTENTRISLLAQAPTPEAAFLLTTKSTKLKLIQNSEEGEAMQFDVTIRKMKACKEHISAQLKNPILQSAAYFKRESPAAIQATKDLKILDTAINSLEAYRTKIRDLITNYPENKNYWDAHYEELEVTLRALEAKDPNKQPFCDDDFLLKAPDIDLYKVTWLDTRENALKFMGVGAAFGAGIGSSVAIALLIAAAVTSTGPLLPVGFMALLGALALVLVAISFAAAVGALIGSPLVTMAGLLCFNQPNSDYHKDFTVENSELMSSVKDAYGVLTSQPSFKFEAQNDGQLDSESETELGLRSVN